MDGEKESNELLDRLLGGVRRRSWVGEGGADGLFPGRSMKRTLNVRTRRRAFNILSPMVLVFLTLAAPKALQAQAQETTTVGEEELTNFARAFVEIEQLRDDVYVQFARSENKTSEAQAQIRETMRQQVLGIIERHQLTEERYRLLTFLVSTDQQQREAFSRILAQINTEEG